MSDAAEPACGFVLVVAGLAGTSWTEIVRAGTPPPALEGLPRTTRGTLEAVLGWIRADSLPDVRDAMQAVRLGAQCRHARIAVAAAPQDGPVLRLEVSGGEWRAGLWAYVLRLDEHVSPAEAVPPSGVAQAPDAQGETGVVEYVHPSFNVRLDAVARRLHGLPDAPERDMPVIRWAACFEGEDQIGAISGLCWPVASELPGRLTLRLARTGAGPDRFLELALRPGTRPGSVQAECRVRAADG